MRGCTSVEERMKLKEEAWERYERGDTTREEWVSEYLSIKGMPDPSEHECGHTVREVISNLEHEIRDYRTAKIMKAERKKFLEDGGTIKEYYEEQMSRFRVLRGANTLISKSDNFLIGDMTDSQGWAGVVDLEDYRRYKEDMERGRKWTRYTNYDEWMKRCEDKKEKKDIKWEV